MINAQGGLFGWPEHSIHAIELLQDVSHPALEGGIVQVNMRDLMVGHRKHLAGTAVEQFQAEFLLDRKPTRFPEDAVKVNGLMDIGDSIFRKENHLNPLVAEKSQQPAYDGINGTQVGNNRRI